MADPTGTLTGLFRFPGEPEGKRGVGVPQQPQFLRFFDEISRVQDLGVDELFNRNLRASIPQIDIGFNQGASRLGESLGGRGLQFGGIAQGANQGLANLLGVSRGQASLESLLQAEDQRRSGIAQALNLFAGLLGIRTGQANINLGAEGIRSGERASLRQDRGRNLQSALEFGGNLASAAAKLFGS